MVILGVAGGSAAYYFYLKKNKPAAYRTAKVERGNLQLSISATGTVEPEELINVGAQVAGQVLSFGKDDRGNPIDYGSQIDAETVLAQIDDSLYTAEREQVAAQVELNKATIIRSEADLMQLKSKLSLANSEWKRAQKLFPDKVIAESEYDSAKSAYDAATANVAVGEASILQAKANLTQAEAILKRAQRNLSYCTIKSPVKGVVIDRRVNIGQTVVASLNAPSLFLIAKDLKRMQVWVAVNEADIGKIFPGQRVSFTVDAYPGETFQGEVGKIRLNASMSQNVVTYTVEVTTDNSKGRLLPYLTANVRFELEGRSNVLLVPNTALRWLPKLEELAPELKKELLGKTQKENSGKIWIQQGKLVSPLKVRTGLSDGSMTEIEGDEVKEATEVIVGMESQAADSGKTSNPFTPTFGGGRR